VRAGRAAFLLLSLVALAPWPAGAKPPAGPVGRSGPVARATRSTVEARLRAYEPTFSASGWQALGPGADEALVEIGRDEKVDILVRARAVSALGYFPTPPARRFLEQTIDSRAASTQAADRLLLRKAAVALGWMGGPGVPARLDKLLAHADPDVRLDAAIGLGLTRLMPAADFLRKRFDIEPDARVRSQIGRQLRVIEDALSAIPTR
jgi:HEAT repeats